MRLRGRAVLSAGLCGLALAAAGAGSAGASSGDPRSAPAPAALMLSYTFANESGTTVTDRSTHGLTGTLVNASGPSAYVKGLVGHGKALRLLGAQHQFVDVGDSPGLDVNSYTLSAWVRYTGVENDRTLGRWEVMEKAGAYWMNIRTTGQVRVGGFYGGCLNADWVYLDSPQPIPVNTWTHLATTYDGTRLAIWVDGTQVAGRAVSGTTCSNDEPLAVGAKNAPAKDLLQAFFDGDLDDVRIYNRALSAPKIASLAKAPARSQVRTAR